MISKECVVKDNKGNEIGFTVGCFGSAPEGFLAELEELVRDACSREQEREGSRFEDWLKEYFIPMD